MKKKALYIQIILLFKITFIITTSDLYSENLLFKDIEFFKSKLIIIVDKKSLKSRLLIEKNHNEKKKQELMNNNKIINDKINNINQEKNLNLKPKKTRSKKIESNKKNLTNLFIKFNPEKEEPSKLDLEKFINNIKILDKDKNIIIKGYAEKREGDSKSKARRLSLKRALFMRSVLLKNDFKLTKIQVKALGYKKNKNNDIVIIDIF